MSKAVAHSIFGSSLEASFLRTICSHVAGAAGAHIAQALGRLDVVMKPFPAAGEADPEVAKSLWQQLAQAIERKTGFRIASGGSAYCYLKGQVLADGERHLVTLRLFKAKTD